MAGGRVVLLITSPRVGAGLLSWPAWEALRSADVVLAADPEPSWQAALAEAETEITDVGDLPVAERAGRLVEAGVAGAQVVWLSSPDGDPGLVNRGGLGRRDHWQDTLVGTCYQPQNSEATGS